MKLAIRSTKSRVKDLFNKRSLHREVTLVPSAISADIPGGNDDDRDVPTTPGTVDGNKSRSIGAGNYEYGPLSLDEKEIRIIEILPGAREEPVRCRLSYLMLDAPDRLPYETISYCWGDPTVRGRVSIDETIVDVPLSTEKALRRARLPDHSRRVWIDAICINQNDFVERARQVNIMRDVYGAGSGNLVELGDGFTGVDVAIRDLKILSKDMLDELAVSRRGFNHFLDYGPRSMGSKFPEVDEVALAAFFYLPWFKRLWVLQEARLARSSVCMCGEEPPFDLLDALRAAVWLSYKKDYVLTHRLQFHSGRTATRYIWTLVDTQYAHRVGNPIKMSLLMNTAHGLETSRSEDKIFGVLGLARRPSGDDATLLEADYSKPLQDIYRDATKYAIYELKSLGLLNQVHHRSDSDLDLDGHGSWVLRLDKARVELLDAVPTRWYMPVRFRHIRTKPRYSRPSHYVDREALEVVGSCLDRVACVSDVFEYEAWTDDGQRLKRVLVQISRMTSAERDSDGRLGLKEAVKPSLSEMAVIVMTMGNGHSNPALVKYLKELFDSILSEDGVSASTWSTAVSDERLYDLQRPCRHRRFYTTRRGHMGLGPGATQVGDCVVGLFGGYTPYVIREIDSGDRRKVNLIGEAYVEGFMEGELMEQHQASGKENDVWWMY